MERREGVHGQVEREREREREAENKWIRAFIGSPSSHFFPFLTFIFTSFPPLDINCHLLWTVKFSSPPVCLLFFSSITTDSPLIFHLLSLFSCTCFNIFVLCLSIFSIAVSSIRRAILYISVVINQSHTKKQKTQNRRCNRRSSGSSVLSGFPNLTVALDQQAYSFLRGM